MCAAAASISAEENELTSTNIILSQLEVSGGGYDPLAAQSLQEFKPIREGTKCTFAPHAKLWGARQWEEKADKKLELEENFAVISKDLKQFIEEAKQKRLDMFVVAAPARYGASLKELRDFMGEILRFLAAQDDSGQNCLATSVVNINSSTWRFTLNQQQLFVAAFAPCYSNNNPRNTYGKDCTFIIFQPYHSFNRHQHRDPNKKAEQKQKIRQAFADDGKAYYWGPMFGPNGPKCDAIRYVKPHKADDPIVKWWEQDEQSNHHQFFPSTQSSEPAFTTISIPPAPSDTPEESTGLSYYINYLRSNCTIL